MKVTEVRIKTTDNQKMPATASVVLDGVLVIHGVKILVGKDHPYIAFPSRKNNEDQKYYDIVHPLNNELRNEIQTAVLEKWQEE